MKRMVCPELAVSAAAARIAQPCPSCGGDNALEEVVAELRLVAADLKTRDLGRLKSDLREIVGHLGAADIQIIPADDRIICDHLRAALTVARGALKAVEATL